MNPTDAPVATTVHPLEPLSAQELSSASALLRAEQDLGPRVRFVFVTLREPSKAQLAAWSDGDSAAARGRGDGLRQGDPHHVRGDRRPHRRAR